MELDGGFDGKRQSLYSPSPNKPTKRTKSEERDDTDSANATSSDQYGKKIGDIMEDLRELSDDLTQQQSQVRWLIHNTAERQRQECSSKFTVKNWWKYAMNSSRDFDLIERHQNAVVRHCHYALESGVCDNKVNQFKFSNYVGRNLSPFCIVDCGDARTRQQVLEHMKKTYGSKMKEWTAEPLKQEMNGLVSDNGNKTGVNGTLTWEPMISTFDKLQSVPLKLAMATIAELRPELSWSKDWLRNTVFLTNPDGSIQTYLAWCAIDHLHGKCTVYFNEDEFERLDFKKTMEKHEFLSQAKKGWGKGKGKTIVTAKSMSQADAMDPDGTFLAQIGLSKGAGKGTSNPYSYTMDKAMKTENPFRLTAKALKSEEFDKVYNEHLYRLLTRWS